MATVAEAFATIRPDFSKFRGEVERGLSKEIDGATRKVGDAGGRNLATRLASSATSHLRGVGDRILSGIGTASRAGAVAAGGVLGGALWGGMQRALDREDAVVSFRRMGLDQRNIDQLTDAIDKALRGTTVTNPQGFNLATRFLATGMALEEIPRRIAAIADMAQVGNRSFEEMADVMARAEGQGRITAAELNRMGDIPFARIAEEMGMTEAEMRKLASEGGLTAGAFAEAFASVDAFNGAAKDATTRQAFANLRTAISALGEQFLGPLLGEGGVAQRALQGLRERAGELGPAVGRAGQAFADWLIPAAQRVGEVLARVADVVRAGIRWFGDNREAIARVAKAAGPAAVALAGVATSVSLISKAWKLFTAATPLGLLLAAGTAIVYLYQNSETFRNIVTAAFEAFRRVVATAMPAVQSAISAVTSFLTGTVMPIVSQVVNYISGQFTNLVGWVRANWEDIRSAIDRVLGVIQAVITQVTNVISALWRAWGDDLLRMVQTAWGFIRSTVESAIKAVQGIIQTVLAIINGDWGKAWDGIKQMLAAVWDQMRNIVSTALDLVRSIIAGALSTIQEVWRGAWRTVASFLSDRWEDMKRTTSNALGAVVQFFRDLPRDLVNGLSEAWHTFTGHWGRIWDGVAGVVSTVWSGITRTVQNAVNTVIDIINGITGGINVVLRFLSLPEIGAIGKLNLAGSGSSAGSHHTRSGGMQQYHTGGIVGADGTPTDGRIRPGEVLAKLLEGEEVLTEDDPRHTKNIGIPDTDWVLPIGGPFGIVGDALGAVGSAIKSGVGWAVEKLGPLRRLIAATARPMVNAALSGVDAATRPFGRIGAMFASLARRVGDGALDWLAGRDAEAEQMEAEAVGTEALGSGWRALVDVFRAAGIPGVVTSTLRFGAGTSLHNVGKAADFSVAGHGNRGYGDPGLRRIFEAFLPYASNLAELILAGAPFNIKGGRRVPGYAWGRPGQPGNHWNHVHAATFDNGGTLQPGWNTVHNATGKPEPLVPELDFPDPDEWGRRAADAFARRSLVLARAG